MNQITETLTILLYGLFAVLMWVGLPAAWLTHVISCLADDRIALLVVGALLFPIGIIHGIAIWFGLV